MYLNISSLSYHHLISDMKIKPKIIGISESRLQKRKQNVINISLPNYVYEHTPTVSSKGGTLLYLDKNLKYKLRKDLYIYHKGMTELTFIEIINKNEKNIVAGCIYKYPKQTIPNFLDNHLLPLLEKLFYQQLVLVTTTLQNFLYQYLNSLLLMNTLSNFLFYFVKKFLTKTQTYLWHLLIFSHCSQIYSWIK